MRVIVADDDVLLRAGLPSILARSGFAVARQAGDAEELLDLVRTHAQDLVIVDIGMPPTHTEEGLEAARAIREEFPHIAILLFSAHIEVEHAMELLASGDRVGYLLKSRVTDVEEYTQTRDGVARGGAVIDPAVVHELVSARRGDDPLAVLSPREREVLALMAEGRSNTGIARQPWVTEGTVEKHVYSILTKLALPETDHDHRRLLAVVTFLRRASGYGCSPSIVADQGLDSAGRERRLSASVNSACASPAASGNAEYWPVRWPHSTPAPGCWCSTTRSRPSTPTPKPAIIAALRERRPDAPPEHQAIVLLCSTRLAAFTHADEVIVRRLPQDRRRQTADVADQPCP
jgi:DNA-binding NarL/FixJ family response regulator